MLTIVFIGAGSAQFTERLLGDLLSDPELRDARIVLHDIDPARLSLAERLARRMAEAVGAIGSIVAELDRRSALRGADFVVNTVQVGGAAASRLDFDVPGRFGLQYAINDTIGVGGVFRALRTLPVVLSLAQEMEEVCPGAELLNFTNPLAIVVRGINEGSATPIVGLCHSVHNTVVAIARYLGLPHHEVDVIAGGVNHVAFVLSIQRRGEDLYPRLREFVRSGGIPETDLVRAELCRQLGYYPTESSEHHADYSPWFIPKGEVDRLRIPLRELLRRVEANLGEIDRLRERLERSDPIDAKRSDEYAATIIRSRVTGRVSRIVGSVMNRAGLIPNLPSSACVEVPCMTDGLGVHPTRIDPLPAQCAAYVAPAVATQDLTVQAFRTRDREAVFWAVLQDPLVQASLTLDQARQLTTSLVEAESEWLPDWLGGAAASGPYDAT